MAYYKSFASFSRWLLLAFLLGCGTAWSGPGAPSPQPAAPAAASPLPATSAPQPAASPTTRQLTLDQALDLAHQKNPTLKIAQAQEREAFYAWKAAGRLPNMTATFNYVGGNNMNGTNNGKNQDLDFALAQSLGPVHSVALAGEAGRKAYQAAQFNTQNVKLTVEQNLKDAFYGLLTAQQQLAVAQENMTLANRIFDVSKTRFDAGAGPLLDVENARIQLATAQQSLIQAEGALKHARTTLNPLLAFRSTEMTEAVGVLDLPTVRVVLSDILDYALRTHPQILNARRVLEQNQKQVEVARSQANPTPSLTYVYDLVTTPLYFIGASLQFPIDWGQIHNTVRQQIAAAEEKKQALESAVLGVDAAVKNAYDNFQTAQRNASVFQSEVLQPSEKVMEMTEFGYSKGALPYLQVLTAQQNLRTARAQYLTLLLSGHQALDALEAAVGKSVGEKP